MHTKDRKNLIFGTLVAAIAFLVYANSLGNGFVLDDTSVILNNPALKKSFFSLFSINDTTNESQLFPFYRPFTYATFFIEWHLHGFTPFLVRLFNVLLHSANAFLVYQLARNFFKENTGSALLAGVLFAIHPLHSEGVDFNAGGRNTMLACFFSLAAYLLHRHGIDRRQAFYAFAGAVLFLSGLFSKETALMILPCIVALEFSPLRDKPADDRSQALLRLAPYMAATAAYLIMRWMTLSKLGIQTSIVPGFGTTQIENMYLTTGIATRLLDNIYIIPRYLLTIVWPVALAPRYVIPDDLNLLVLPLLGGWIVILGGLGWCITKGRSAATLFGLAWMVLFWLPVSGIVFVPGAPLADRFLYIPAIGLWIVLSDQIGRLFPPDRPAYHRRLMTAVCLVLLTLAITTIRRNLDWRSDLSLYSRFVAQYPDNVHARAGMGKVYYGKSKWQDIEMAEREFEAVLAMDPNFPMIYTYLGNIKLNKNELAEALYNYSRAVEVFPYDKEARINRGITLEKLGRPKEALTDYLFFLASPGSFDKLPGARQHAEQKIRELSK